MISYSTVVNPRPLKPVAPEVWAAAERAYGRPSIPVKRIKPRHIARGHPRVDRPDMRQMPINFDMETFAELRAIAVKQRRPFAAVVREMVEWGLMEFHQGERS